MKRIIICCLSALMLLLCCTACQSSKQKADTALAPTSIYSPENTTPAPETEDTEPVDVSNGDIDVDLTKLSSTMMYSEVYKMVNEPEDYYGKTVRMKGTFKASFFEGTGNYYYYVIIADATACCAQGIEFVWNGEHSYPQDYPENGTEVEVTGVYGCYVEEGIEYDYIRTDSIEIVDA